MRGKRKAINFDLDTNKLKEFYTAQTGKKYNSAYYDIEAFMKKNGFIHRQGSGYISELPMSFSDISVIVDNMGETMTWLKQCVRHVDVTAIESQFDLAKVIIQGNTEAPTNEMQQTEAYGDLKETEEDDEESEEDEYELEL